MGYEDHITTDNTHLYAILIFYAEQEKVLLHSWLVNWYWDKVGTMADHPPKIYHPDANKYVSISLKVPSPPNAPPTYWGLVYDLRSPDWPVGHDTFLVICREHSLVDKCLESFHKGDVVCIEGSLVLTLLPSDGDLVPLAEILACDVILLTEHSSVRLQQE